MKTLGVFINSTIIILLIMLNVAISEMHAQNITITDDVGYTAHESAMLDVKSATKGLLIPRVTTDAREAITPLAKGLLVFDTDESVFYYYDGTVWVNMSKGQIWDVNSNYVLLTDSTAKVGIGTYTPNSKLEVKADASFTDTDTLFAVKDKNGNIVFAVFPDGAAVYVNDMAKGKIGGFAVSGRNPAKATETEYLKVTPDSTRVWVNSSSTKGKIGGFAVSGRNPAKGTSTDDYMVITPDSARIYINDTVGVKGKIGGFAISGRNPAKGTSKDIFLATVDSTRIYIDETNMKGKIGGFAISGRNPAKGIENKYMEVSRDSTRIYVTEDLAKGKIGGFAISGRNPAKGVANDYFNISGNTSADKVNNESRVMWYPQKAALLAGNVHVGSADSVGENSVAIGYRNISMGKYSQAFGYQSYSIGKNSTAIGNSAQALVENSFALGDSAIARGIGSYAFGSTGIDTTSGTSTNVQTIANGDYSFAFGFGSYADKVGSYAMGINSEANGKYAFAIGTANKANAKGAYTLGSQCQADGQASFAIGYLDTASTFNSFAIGAYNHAIGVSSFAMGFYNRTDSAGAFAIGNGNIATRPSSFAFGTLTKATGKFATSFGNSTEASGGSSTAMGWDTHASGYRSFAGGRGSQASGEESFAYGLYNHASGDYSTALGNTITVSGTSSFGIGLDIVPRTVSQNNTFAIMGGKVGINTAVPDYDLDIAGYLNIGKGIIGAGKIVFRVDGDEALWYNGTVFSWGAGAGGATPGNGYNYFQDPVGIGISTKDYWLSVAGTANLNSGIGSGVALRVDGDEAIYYNGSRFNWGYGGTYNYFADKVGIGTTSATASKLNIEGVAPVVRIEMNETDRKGQLIRFADYTGDQGAISIDAGTISYNAFTGSHYANVNTDSELSKGILLELSGDNNSNINNDSESEIVYGAVISANANSKNILGAYLGDFEHDEDETYDLVMAVGNGVMWVADNGENLEVGDYLISSSVAGHAMKDLGEFEVSNIIGRVAEPVNWENETEMIDGVKHKLISVFYENFRIKNIDNELDKKVQRLEQENQKLLDRIKLIEEKLN